MLSFKTSGVCAREINFTIEEDRIKDIYFVGGCDGNLKGISNLVKGMKISEVIDRLEDIRCGSRSTSCPHQLSLALRAYMDMK